MPPSSKIVMSKYLFIILTAISVSLYSIASANDKLITDAINSGDWFALDSAYKAGPKDSISDFIDTYSRCLIGNRFNRPDVSIPAFEKLLNGYSQELGRGKLINNAILLSIDLSRVGENEKAASVLKTILDANRKDLKSGAIKGIENFIRQYKELEEYNPYTISFDADTGCVPFKLVPVGKPEENGLHIHLEDSYINGIGAEITFDTGAAVNVISDSLVGKFDLIPLDVETKVSGARSHGGTLAIVKEMKIGNITINDVPFYVMDITADNSEADQYMKSIDIIVGSELMLQLKDITIDFVNSQITIPAAAPVKTDTPPNMCFSSGMNLITKGAIRDSDMLMNIDTGDASYGFVGDKFYKHNKKYIKSKAKPMTIRKAGIGGVDIAKCYRVPDMSLEIGGNSVIVPSLVVLPKKDSFGHECNIGLKSLMLFKKIRFNLVDFIFSTSY